MEMKRTGAEKRIDFLISLTTYVGVFVFTCIVWFILFFLFCIVF